MPSPWSSGTSAASPARTRPPSTPPADIGRLTEPMRYDAASDKYVPVTWDDAFALVERHLRGLASPNEAAFYTSGRYRPADRADAVRRRQRQICPGDVGRCLRPGRAAPPRPRQPERGRLLHLRPISAG